MISKTDIENVHPLSPIQQGVLVHCLQTPGSSSYFGQQVYELEGSLDVACLQRAWQSALDRHSVLRSAFLWEGVDRMLQVVFRHVSVPWDYQDWKSVEEVDRREHLDRFLQADRGKGFNLAQAPLLRIAVIALTERNYYFVLSQHHLLLDGWSYGLLLKEVMAHYRALSAGRSLEIPVPRPYQEYVQWLEEQEIWEAEAFWYPRLSDFDHPTALPFIKPGRASGTFAEREWQLTQHEAQRLQSFVQQRHFTISTVIQGAWAVLLGRHSCQQDVLFGNTVSVRPAALAGVERMIGLFINTLPARVHLDQHEAVNDLLLRIQTEQIEARDHGFASLAQIHGWSGVARDRALFDSILVVENYPVNVFETEYSMDPVGDDSLRVGNAGGFARTHYPLTIHVLMMPRLVVQFVYDRGKFSDEAIDLLVNQLQILLDGMVSNLESRLSDLRMISLAQEQHLLSISRGREQQARYSGLSEAIAQQASRAPEATAILCGSLRLTYRELEQRTTQVARYLAALGVETGACVAVCMERSVEMIVAILGVLKAGAAYVPLDPRYPAERIEYMVHDCKAPVLLMHSRTAGRLHVGSAIAISLDEEWDQISNRDDASFERHIEPGHLAYVMFTSGSTGKPKGVGVTHEGMMNYLNWAVEFYAVAQGSGAPMISSFAFDLSVTSLFTPLLASRTLYLLEEHQDLGSLAEVAASSEKFSFIKMTPSHLRALTQLLLARSNGNPATGARAFILGGEQLLAADLSPWNRQSSSLRIINEYGPTEAVVGCVAHEVRTIDGANAVPIGCPITNAEVFVVEEEGRMAAMGVPGELLIGGACLARGYMNDPAMTAARFRPHPFSTKPGARLYCSGDLARWNENNQLEYVGRMDQQVKIRGHRVEVSEIETIFSLNPDVRSCAVQACHEKADAPDLRLVAYVVPASPSIELDMLKDWLRKRLPEYMVPAVFVRLDWLPLNSNGKIDYRRLPAPDGAATASAAQFEPPITDTEKALAAIWEGLLGRKQLGRHESFFNAGGHSLLVTQLVSRVHDDMQLEIPFNLVFEFPTIAELSRKIDELRQDLKVQLPPLGADGPEHRPELLVQSLDSFSEKEIDAYLAKFSTSDVPQS